MLGTEYGQKIGRVHRLLATVACDEQSSRYNRRHHSLGYVFPDFDSHFNFKWHIEPAFR